MLVVNNYVIKRIFDFMWIISVKMVCTNVDKCDMLEPYILCQKSSQRALERYNGDVSTNILYLQTIQIKWKFTNNVPKETFILNEITEINILAYLEAFRENYTGDCIRDIGLCFENIPNVLVKYKFLPYKYRRLLPGDIQNSNCSNLGLYNWNNHYLLLA